MTCSRLSALALCVWSALLAPASGEEVRAVPHVDLPRYAGQWFEVARFPNWFQKKCAGDVAVIYSLRDDGRLTVDNRCHNAGGGAERAVGVARLATKDGSNSKLKVRFAPSALSFLPFVWADYGRQKPRSDDCFHAISQVLKGVHRNLRLKDKMAFIVRRDVGTQISENPRRCRARLLDDRHAKLSLITLWHVKPHLGPRTKN